MPQTIQYFQDSQIFSESTRTLGNESRDALAAIYAFVFKAYETANGRDPEVAAAKLEEFEQQTVDALEYGGSHGMVIRNFAKVYHKYDFDPTGVEVLFAALRMDTTHTNFTAREYKIYVAGVGEAVGLMALKVLCYKRAVLYHKLIPAARGLGAAICKVNLLLNHGKAHKRHGRMYFPEVDKSTFNQARLAQVLVSAEADFRVARAGIPMLPAGTRRAATLLYVYYYDLLMQMRHLTPHDIDAGRASISDARMLWLQAYAYASPKAALQRGKLG